MEYHSKQIETFCPHCKELQTILGTENLSERRCTKCNEHVLSHGTDAFHASETLNQCPACGCTHLFRQRDFNRRLGMAILVVGIVLSFFTYGISLLFVTVLDLFLYFKVKEVAVCYGCSAVYRGYSGIPRLEPFQLVLHDHYRMVSE